MVTVTNDTKVIQGVTTRVVRDLVTEGGVPVEDTNDYFAQKIDGTVWYFGELVQNFEDGELRDLDGSFQAGRDGAKAGIIMKAMPMVGDFYRQEFALGDAEDVAEVISTTGNESVPGASCNNACVVTRDINPLEPGVEEQQVLRGGHRVDPHDQSRDRRARGAPVGHPLRRSMAFETGWRRVCALVEAKNDAYRAIHLCRGNVAERVGIGGDVAEDRLRRGQRRRRQDSVEVLTVPVVGQPRLVLSEHGARKQLPERCPGRDVQRHDRRAVVPESLAAEIDLRDVVDRQLGPPRGVNDDGDARLLVRARPAGRAAGADRATVTIRAPISEQDREGRPESRRREIVGVVGEAVVGLERGGSRRAPR